MAPVHEGSHTLSRFWAHLDKCFQPETWLCVGTFEVFLCIVFLTLHLGPLMLIMKDTLLALQQAWSFGYLSLVKLPFKPNHFAHLSLLYHSLQWERQYKFRFYWRGFFFLFKGNSKFPVKSLVFWCSLFDVLQNYTWFRKIFSRSRFPL